MNDDFIKLDEWMLEATRREREGRVPEKDLLGFQEGVMRKIMERQRRGFGFPSMGLAMVSVFSLAVIFGAVVYLNRMPSKKETPVVSSAPAPVAAPVIKKVILPVANVIPNIPVTVPEVKVSGPSVSVSQPSLLSESEIMEEIEALKELGAWTEEDEERAGIPVEVSFADLDMAPDFDQSTPAPAT